MDNKDFKAYRELNTHYPKPGTKEQSEITKAVKIICITIATLALLLYGAQALKEYIYIKRIENTVMQTLEAMDAEMEAAKNQAAKVQAATIKNQQKKAQERKQKEAIYQQLNNTCQFWRESLRKNPRDREAQRWQQEACQRAAQYRLSIQ